MDITTVNETTEQKANIEWLMSDNVDNVCRACLRVGDLLINLYNENDDIKFISCTQLQMDKQDGLPACLCVSCFNILTHFYNFKQLCCQSDGALRQHLFRNPERIKIEIPEFDIQEHKDDTLQDDLLSDNDDKSFSNKASKDLHHDDLGLLQEHSSVDAFATRKETHYGLRAFKCDICNLTFKESKTLTDHRRTHMREKPYECKLCGHTFLQKTALNQHMKSHNKNSETQDESVSCSICNKRLKSSFTLRKHMILHKGEKKYKCTTCNRSFMHSMSLKLHESLHTGVQSYVCHICGIKFRQNECLMIHLRNHDGVKPYSCDQCGNKFARKSELERHIIRHGPRNIPCSHCPLKFHLKKDKDKHEKRHFPKLYSCEICGKSFKTISFMAEHKRSHTGDRPYQCDVCSQSFKSRGALRGHKMIHTGERPYKCQICDRGFIQKTPYNRHMKSHIKMNSNEHAINTELNSDASQDNKGNIHMLNITQESGPHLFEFQSVNDIHNEDGDVVKTFKIEKMEAEE